MSSARATSRSSSSGSPTVVPQGTPAENATPVVARFADPGPLGLAAFALTTFVLSFANAGIIPTAGAAVLGLALFYGGAVQLLAGLWEFANKNTFGATAFCTYGAFWMAFWYLVATKGDVAARPAGVGIFLIAFGIFTLYMTVAALKTNLALIGVFAFLTLTFFALGIGAASSAVGPVAPRRLARHHHRPPRVVHLVRGRHEQHLQASRAARLPPRLISGRNR